MNDDAAASAVRRYLAWIDDPSTAVDADAVAAAQAAFDAAEDPLERLHAAAALEKASNADVAGLERDFVAHAKAYADANDLPASAFSAVGVGGEVLLRAGFAVAARGTRRGEPAASSAPVRRAPQVSADQLKAVAVQMPKHFTLAQLAERAGGGSPATVRKAVEDLIAAGRVRNLGPDPDHSGPGRAPTRYELV